jgi:hypothetical protein
MVVAAPAGIPEADFFSSLPAKWDNLNKKIK